jgi:serine/threonine protein kinase
METFGGWELIEPPLGRGGQGTVYKARFPQRTVAIANARTRVRDAIWRLSNSERITPKPDDEVELNNLVSSMNELSRPDDPARELGALKKFDIPSDGSPEAVATVHRLEREVEALRAIQHPGILRLIAANPDERWFVTEYHSGGTLAAVQSRYKGDALSALRAFRTIVEAVAELHKKGYVHRDIKSKNVFIATNGNLVLGDFGIVFFEDEQHTRITEQDERVGSRDWMAPWAHTGVRVDEVRPTFDVFPLGKLLWTMLSGRQILPPYFTHRSPGFGLEEIFPGRPGMDQVNSILDKCIVIYEQDCLQNASPLHDMVVSAIGTLEQVTTVQQIVLAAAGGDFRVQVTASQFQLNAVPLRRNRNGEWVPEESAQSPLARWRLEPNGGFIRIVSGGS